MATSAGTSAFPAPSLTPNSDISVSTTTTVACRRSTRVRKPTSRFLGMQRPPKLQAAPQYTQRIPKKRVLPPSKPQATKEIKLEVPDQSTTIWYKRNAKSMKMEAVEPPAKKQRTTPSANNHSQETILETQQLPEQSTLGRKKFKRHTSSLTNVNDARRLSQTQPFPPNIERPSNAVHKAPPNVNLQQLRTQQPSKLVSTSTAAEHVDGKNLRADEQDIIDASSLRQALNKETRAPLTRWTEDKSLVRNQRQEVQYLPSLRTHSSLDDPDRTFSDPTHAKQATVQGLAARAKRVAPLYERRGRLALEPLITAFKAALALVLPLQQPVDFQVGPGCPERWATDGGILQVHDSISEGLRTGIAELFSGPGYTREHEAATRIITRTQAPDMPIQPPFYTMPKSIGQYHADIKYWTFQYRMLWLGHMRTPSFRVPMNQDRFVTQLLAWPEDLQSEGPEHTYQGLCLFSDYSPLLYQPNIKQPTGSNFGITWTPEQGRATQSCLCRAAMIYQLFLLDVDQAEYHSSARRGILEDLERYALVRNVQAVYTLLGMGYDWNQVIERSPCAGLEVGVDRPDEEEVR